MITNEQQEILRHTSNTGRYVTGDPTVIAMAENGLLYDYGPQALAAGDHYLVITHKGRAALNEWQRAQPKPVKPKRRRSAVFEKWQRFLSGIPFDPGGEGMKELPILMQADMVRATLAGLKSQTRRVIMDSFNGCMCLNGPHPCPSPPTHFKAGETHATRDEWHFFCSTMDRWIKCQYGQPGDRLWVRETFLRVPGNTKLCLFRASCKNDEVYKWTPSIFMPRWASRITLEITDIRYQRVQDISAEDAMAEGTLCDNNGRRKIYGYKLPVDQSWRQSPIDAYMHLWDSINAKRGFGWDVNPWVWVISFRRL